MFPLIFILAAMMQAQYKPAAAQSHDSTGPSLILASPDEQVYFNRIQGPRITLSADSLTSVLFVFSNDGKVTLQISKDGSMKFGEGVTPTEAAKEFAVALKQLWPTCPATGSGK